MHELDKDREKLYEIEHYIDEAKAKDQAFLCLRTIITTTVLGMLVQRGYTVKQDNDNGQIYIKWDRDPSDVAIILEANKAEFMPAAEVKQIAFESTLRPEADEQRRLIKKAIDMAAHKGFGAVALDLEPLSQIQVELDKAGYYWLTKHKKKESSMNNKYIILCWQNPKQAVYYGYVQHLIANGQIEIEGEILCY